MSEQAKQELDVFRANGILITTPKENSNGTKSEVTTVAKRKALALAFPELKKDALTLKIDEGGRALLAGIGMEIGGLMTNSACIGVSSRHTTKKNGNKRHVFTVEEQCAKSASETAFAAYCGITVEEVRKMRAAAVAKAQATINVNATSTPVPPAVPPQP